MPFRSAWNTAVVTADLLADLEARGLVHDTTDRAALAARLADGPITLYHGIDPTADSLHTGNLIGLLVLRRFQEAGHRPLALAGGATGMVGDPSGRSQERNLLDEATLNANVAAIKGQITRVLDAGDAEVELVDNRDWTAPLTLLDFLRDVGKHATVNTMLARESVKIRMDGEEGISFTEFSYMLLQANDYRELLDTHGCELQVGGSDQWGNILAGVDLIRRSRQRSVHALSWPLITAPDGTKLGKTTGARIWLDAARTSPYQFFQHWMQTEDSQVAEFLAKFTFRPMAEVGALATAHAEAPEKREAQRALARDVTGIVHGAEAARGAEEASVVLFGGSIEAITPGGLEALLGEMPVQELPRTELEGLDIVDALHAAGLVASKGEGRRLVAQGGANVNGERAGEGRTLGAADLVHGRSVVLRKGKRDYAALTCR